MHKNREKVDQISISLDLSFKINRNNKNLVQAAKMKNPILDSMLMIHKAKMRVHLLTIIVHFLDLILIYLKII